MAGLYSLIDPDSDERFPVHRLMYLFTLVHNGTLTVTQARGEIETALGRVLDAGEATDLGALNTELGAAADPVLYLTVLEAVCGEVEAGNSLTTEAAFNSVLGI